MPIAWIQLQARLSVACQELETDLGIGLAVMRLCGVSPRAGPVNNQILNIGQAPRPFTQPQLL